MFDDKEIYSKILNNLSLEVVFYNRDGKIEFINEMAEKNESRRLSSIGKSEAEFCEAKGISSEIAQNRVEKIQYVFEMKVKIDFEEIFVLPQDGDKHYYFQELIPIFERNGDFRGVLRQGTNITWRKKIESEFEYLAFHDSLTGLPNRRYLYKELENLQTTKLHKPTSVCIMLLDLDRFKAINDTLGHMTGDELIRSVAGRILKLFSDKRYPTIVSRLGGDEFVIAIIGIEDYASIEDLASKIIESFRFPFSLISHELFVTTSIGIYQYNTAETKEDPEAIIHKADIAMYNAKEMGRNKYKFFVKGMKTKAQNVFSLETKLYRAYKNDEFILVYQPKIDTQTQKINSLEALLRWNKDGNLISPSEFLFHSEDTELFNMIGAKVFQMAFKAASKLHEKTGKEIRISINLSENQFFDEKLITNLLNYSKQTGSKTDWIDVEVKENIIMKNIDLSSKIIHQLHEIGVRIAIDNFGTGSSSLSKLKNTLIDIINIDKSFIKNITDSYQDAAITGAIVSMAQSLKIKVNAEGIENKDQLLFLKYLKCDMMQGFIFSKPIVLEEAEKLLISHPDYSEYFKEEDTSII
jgi:diguanylate cyclase (GGDEF)-like protein